MPIKMMIVESSQTELAKRFLIFLIAVASLAACSTTPPEEEDHMAAPEVSGAPTVTAVEEEVEQFQLRTEAFNEGDPLPLDYSCDGEDISPPLSWSGVPEGTVSFTLIVEDPDAPAGT